jgi:hypothetical protein
MPSAPKLLLGCLARFLSDCNLAKCRAAGFLVGIGDDLVAYDPRFDNDFAFGVHGDVTSHSLMLIENRQRLACLLLYELGNALQFGPQPFPLLTRPGGGGRSTAFKRARRCLPRAMPSTEAT